MRSALQGLLLAAVNLAMANAAELPAPERPVARSPRFPRHPGLRDPALPEQREFRRPPRDRIRVVPYGADSNSRENCLPAR